MTITIDAPAEVEAAIARKAERAGMSLPEFTLRALLAIELNESADQAEDMTAEEREARRLAAIKFLGSGYFARTGLSTADLFADRREELRRELATGQEALDRGEYRDYASGSELMEDIAKEGGARLATRDDAR